MEVYEMDRKDLYQLIYEFLVVRIEAGWYTYGEQILIKPLADFFHISTITIRNAFSLLEHDGYIKVEKNQKATIIYNSKGSEHEMQLSQLSYCEFDDIDKSYKFLLSEIIWHALRLNLKQEKTNIREYIQKDTSVSRSFSVLFLKKSIEILGNSLLLELHRDIFLFTYPTRIHLLQESDKYRIKYSIRHHIVAILDSCETGKLEDTYVLIQWLYTSNKDSIASSKLEFSKFPFHWNTSQVRFQIASDFIAQCHTKRYEHGVFTPSMKELANHYNVSYMTMRRTFSLLNKLGVIETINGIGTRFLTIEEGSKKIQWANKEIQKHILSFLCAMQILVMIAKKITLDMISKLSNDDIDKMLIQLQNTLDDNVSSYIFGLWLNQVIAKCELGTLREIYSHLANLLVWGYPLGYIRKVRHLSKIIQDLIYTLENRDNEKFAQIIESYCYITFVQAKKTILTLGIKEAEDIKTPNIICTDIFS